jgi:hypothetical protein
MPKPDMLGRTDRGGRPIVAIALPEHPLSMMTLRDESPQFDLVIGYRYVHRHEARPSPP